MSRNLTGKRILCLLVPGFNGDRYFPLVEGLMKRSAAVAVASFNAGDTLLDAAGERSVTVDYSFTRALDEEFDAVVILDDATADAMQETRAAADIVVKAWETGHVIITINLGVLILTGNGMALAISEGTSNEHPYTDIDLLCRRITDLFSRDEVVSVVGNN
ncbi:MAG: DJ-1/PfpI family protein [Armatimonadota bacterium]